MQSRTEVASPTTNADQLKEISAVEQQTAVNSSQAMDVEPQQEINDDLPSTIEFDFS